MEKTDQERKIDLLALFLAPKLPARRFQVRISKSRQIVVPQVDVTP